MELKPFFSEDKIVSSFTSKYKGKYPIDDVINHAVKANIFDYDVEGKTCAVVGSAPNILNKRFGKEIDGHDYIFRANDARIEGFEDWCGSRTDFRTVSGKCFSSTEFERTESPIPTATWFPRLKGEHFLVRPFPNNIDRVFGVYDLHYNWNNNKISYVHHDLEKYVCSLLNCREASSGFISIFLAVTIFQKVDIYGYEFYGGKESQPGSHYHKNLPVPCGTVHSYSAELACVKSWEEQGILTINE